MAERSLDALVELFHSAMLFFYDQKTSKRIEGANLLRNPIFPQVKGH